jgi:hypothetical protein
MNASVASSISFSSRSCAKRAEAASARRISASCALNAMLARAASALAKFSAMMAEVIILAWTDKGGATKRLDAIRADDTEIMRPSSGTIAAEESSEREGLEAGANGAIDAARDVRCARPGTRTAEDEGIGAGSDSALEDSSTTCAEKSVGDAAPLGVCTSSFPVIDPMLPLGEASIPMYTALILRVRAEARGSPVFGSMRAYLFVTTWPAAGREIGAGTARRT